MKNRKIVCLILCLVLIFSTTQLCFAADAISVVSSITSIISQVRSWFNSNPNSTQLQLLQFLPVISYNLKYISEHNLDPINNELVNTLDYNWTLKELVYLIYLIDSAHIPAIHNTLDTILTGVNAIVPAVASSPTASQMTTLIGSVNAGNSLANINGTYLSTLLHNLKVEPYNSKLVKLFDDSGAVMQRDSIFYAGFSSDIPIHVNDTLYVGVLCSKEEIAYGRMFVKPDGSLVGNVLNDTSVNSYLKFCVLPPGDYTFAGYSRMRNTQYVPLFMCEARLVPQEYRAIFGLDNIQSSLNSIDGHVDGVESTLTSIDGHVDGVEGLLNSISLNTDTVESKLTTIDGHVDDVESKLDLIHNDLQNLPSGGGDSNTDIDVDLDLNFVDIAADLGVSVDFLKDTFDTGVDIPDSLALLILPDYFFTQDVYDTVNGSYPDVELVPLSEL